MGSIYSYQTIKKFCENGIIYSSSEIENVQFQPNTLDLRLSNIAYRVRSSFLTRQKTVREKIKEHSMYEIDISKGAILEKGCVYIIPLQEKLNLPKEIFGKTNPKSSTGRLDIFTRVITDYNFRFNYIETGYCGELFLEIAPMSFTISVEEGDSLCQLRLMSGSDISLSDSELRNFYKTNPFLFSENGVVLESTDVSISNGVFLSVDLLSGNDGIIGYKSKKNSEVIKFNKKGIHPTLNFWDPIHANDNGELIIEPEGFYIFASKERITIPGGLCGEMVPYDPDSGELRVHYAGFFDTGFGADNGFMYGAKAVLEVRPHDVPFLIEDGQILCRIRFDRNDQVPECQYGAQLCSSYQHQGLQLSKHFCDTN